MFFDAQYHAHAVQPTTDVFCDHEIALLVVDRRIILFFSMLIHQQ